MFTSNYLIENYEPLYPTVNAQFRHLVHGEHLTEFKLMFPQHLSLSYLLSTFNSIIWQNIFAWSVMPTSHCQNVYSHPGLTPTIFCIFHFKTVFLSS